MKYCIIMSTYYKNEILYNYIKMKYCIIKSTYYKNEILYN